MQTQVTHALTFSTREIVEALRAHFPTSLPVQAMPEPGGKVDVKMTSNGSGSVTLTWSRDGAR